jgi:hypothetical protein
MESERREIERQTDNGKRKKRDRKTNRKYDKMKKIGKAIGRQNMKEIQTDVGR